MSEQLRESLSAAMDGEADAFELRRVLDEAKMNDELREQWHRFHLLRDILREDVKTYHPGLRGAIHDALDRSVDDEDTVAELVLAEEAGGERQSRSPWLGRIGGTAVAAAVAAAVIIGGGVFEEPQPDSDFAAIETLSLEPTPAMYNDATLEDMQRQNGLILRHIQHKAINQTGVASFVKMATFRSEPRKALRRSQPAQTGPSREAAPSQ